MTDPSVTQQVKFDAICIQFEQAWRDGQKPAIESFLDGVSDAERSLLLPQLLLLELEYVENAGTSPEIEAYLERFPHDQAAVRDAFEAHTAASEGTNDASVKGNNAGTIDQQPITERAGSQIGRYKLLEQIGEGGMGVVYMAEQQRPVRRKVALKIIKPGMDTKQVVARFEAERQALAMMDHPNIARVLDAGSTDSRRSLRDRSGSGLGGEKHNKRDRNSNRDSADSGMESPNEAHATIGGAIGDSGRPYFVMELVRGTTITEYCDANKLNTDERLKLFKLVCQAVQHAHTKGIIHRDLKPTNVLVTLHDGVPVPKIIDFGVSKAMGQQLTEKTMFTAFSQMVGTPLYMSPEQAEMSGLDIDTRSDIYSLGVLLYELLTGVTPFDRQRLHTAAFDELRRIIREEEPEKPSTRVSSLGESSVTVSAQRSTDPAKLRQVLRGELDWIVMKALEKDRNRRYETANALVAEVDRYLAGEPVHACPPSTTYRLRKFANKYKSQVAMAAGFAAMLVVSSIVAWYLYADARIARNEAVAARDDVTVERDRALAAEREAAQNLQSATSQRDRAEAEKRRADRHADELKERLYDYNLIQAVTAHQEGNLVAMRSLLEDCLEDQRGWEWYRMQCLMLPAGEEPLDFTAHILISNPVKPQLAIGGVDGTVQLWDDATGEVLWTKATGNKSVTDLAFTPDGASLLVSHASQNLRALEGPALSPDFRSGLVLWDAVTGRQRWEDSPQGRVLIGGEFSPDGQRFANMRSSSLDGPFFLELRNTGTGEVLWTGAAPGLPMAGAFSPNNTHSFTCFWNKPFSESSGATIACWNVDDHQQVWSIEHPRPSDVRITDGGTRFVTAGMGSLQIRDAATGELIDSLPCRHVGNFYLNQDASRLICHGFDGTVTVWDWEAKKELLSERSPYAWGRQFAFCHDGRRVAAFGEKGSSLEFFYIAKSEQPDVLTLVGHENELRCLTFGPNDELVSVGVDGTLRTWNPHTGQETSLVTVASDAKSVAYSPDGKYLATGGVGGAKLWETSSGRPAHQWSEMGDVFWFAFDTAGKRLAAGGREKTLKVWNVADGTTLMTYQAQGAIDGLAIDDDRNLAIVLGTAGSIETVNLTTGEAKNLRAPGSTEWTARCLCRLPNSSLVAAGMREAVEFWDLDRGVQIRSIRTSDTKSLAFSKDATRLFTGDLSGNVKVWNVESGAQLLSWSAHVGIIYSLTLSPDGRTLVTAGSDGLVKIWETKRLRFDVAQKREIVGAATNLVNDLYRQSGALRDVMARLTNDESVSTDVRRVAMEIASARGDRPRGPM